MSDPSARPAFRALGGASENDAAEVFRDSIAVRTLEPPPATRGIIPAQVDA